MHVSPLLTEALLALLNVNKAVAVIQLCADGRATVSRHLPKIARRRADSQ